MFDLESRRERRKYSVGLGLIVLFIFSGVSSCTELKYTLWGRTTEAVVRQTSEFEGRIVVRYHFKDGAGEVREGSSRISPSDWTAVEGRKVEVVYLPRTPGTSTMVIARSMLYPVIFGIMLMAIFAWCAYAYSEAKQGRLVGGDA